MTTYETTMSAKSLVAVRRVGALGRVVIPDSIRDTLGLEPGTPISIFVLDQSVVIEKLDVKQVPDDFKDETKEVLAGVFDDIRTGKLDKEAFINSLWESQNVR